MAGAEGEGQEQRRSWKPWNVADEVAWHSARRSRG